MNSGRLYYSESGIGCLLFIFVLLTGCNSNSDSSSKDNYSDRNRNIHFNDIALDIQKRRGEAQLTVAGSYVSQGISLDVGDLLIDEVLVNGSEPDYHISVDRLDIRLPKTSQDVVVSVSYTFQYHEKFNGVSSAGHSFTWPYYCGNVFPCHTNPSGGSKYKLKISGVPDGLQAVYPIEINTEAPSYMLGFSIDDYSYLNLGITEHGTEVGVYYRSEEYSEAVQGTLDLKEIINWFEQNVGAYAFGDHMASVSVAWKDGGYGGMEHHPYWHISNTALANLSVHVHEAIHGWFGNSVRISCWEELVLSEGIASYLTARAIKEIVGEAEADTVWSKYYTQLQNLQNSSDNKIAWPDGCGKLDIFEDELFGVAPYMKGAFFLKDLEGVIGTELLDQSLRTLYMTKRGQAVRFSEFLDIIDRETGFDPRNCAYGWLRSESLPENNNCG
ncbi:MAG: M1 family aminopeptidase [Candidatus Thiodiazotropha sp. 6PLUC2]